MKEIIIASGNKGKIKEAQEILQEYKIVPMKELGVEIDVEEDQETFVGNAVKKAETIARELNGKMCIADDSGIEIVSPPIKETKEKQTEKEQPKHRISISRMNIPSINNGIKE